MKPTAKISRQVRKLTSEKKTHGFVRIGFAARGVLYGAVAVFALLFSYGIAGGLTDVRGALRRLIQQPFGAAILCVVGAGLFCYAIWRIAQAWRDYEGHGRDAKGIALRLGYFFAGLIHLGLGYYAINLVWRFTRDSGGKESEKQIAGWLLDQPFGRWLLGALALGVFGFGISQGVLALREKFLGDLKLPSDKKRWIVRVCKVGLIARGLVFCVVGWLFMRAATQANANQAGGIDAVWDFLSSQSFGSVLVPLLALGLLAFAASDITQAIYRKV